MKQWFVAQTKCNDEQTTGLRLVAQGYHVYVPMAPVDKRNSRSKKEKVPLFPTYLFVRLEEGRDEFRPVKNTMGVMRIIRLSRDDRGVLRPTPVPDRLIEKLKAAETQGTHSVKHDYQEGDVVRIKAGPFYGVEAIVQSTSPDERVNILFEIMGREVAAEMDYRKVEPV